LIFTGLAAGMTVVSCSSSEDPAGPGVQPSDAGQESSTTPDVDTSDAGDADALISLRDAAPYDGGPLPIVCASHPCAKSLTTTRPPVTYEYNEGYCALLDDGTVACWGSNGYRELGRGDDAGTEDSATAARVEGLSNVVQLDHTCAVDKDGGASCWGTGAFLRNDAGTTSTERAPFKLNLPGPAKRVAMGLDVMCAELEDQLLCWGKNSKAQIVPLDVAAWYQTVLPTPIAIPSGAPIRELLVGNAVIAVREDGTTLSWGGSPLLGRISSMDPDPNPMAIPLTDLSSIDVSIEAACATVLGVGYCWGRAVSPPTVFDRVLPEPVATPEPIVQIATSRAIQRAMQGDIVKQPQRWCAVGASGDVYCWGYNEGGQAGDGTKEHAYNPVKVKGLPAPAADVKVQPDSTCALLTNGNVYCWGTNYYGQLGNGEIRTPSLVPQEVVLP
jgi:alpha-tubulin suppressor-like RCC1 family protein